MRIYPDQIPEYWLEPTDDSFEVKRVEGSGFALFTKKAFKKGQQLFIFSGTIMQKATQHSLQLATGLHIHDPWVMGYSLHSCAPNCTVNVRERTFTALKDIAAGDLVTMDYQETEDYLYKDFVCGCGSCDSAQITGRAVGKESEDRRIIRLLTENNWHFAKTLSHIPHYYSRGREWSDVEDFYWACEYIQKNSTTGTFKETGKYVYNYFHLGKWKYWVMERDKPSTEQILINRAANEDIS